MPRYDTVHSADPPLAYPGLAVRIGSFIIDAALLLAIDVGAALAIVIPAAGYLDPGGALTERVDAAEIALWIGLRWFYYAGWESSRFRATPGAMACHLAVIDVVDGGPLSFAQASIRYFARYLSVATCGLSWALVYHQQKRRTVHDLLSGSVAVRFEPETAIRAAIDANPASAARIDREHHQRTRAEERERPRRAAPAGAPKLPEAVRRAAALKAQSRATGRSTPSDRSLGENRRPDDGRPSQPRRGT